MAYKALYRTYRPQTFEEVAGQQHIVKTLKNALATGKIAHAYLFTGPRGTGKTTMAKIFAKALNCEEGVGHQCNHCKNCQEITDGTHPDVLELDAASNNGVDEIRDLIDKVKYGTILGKYKVYIIDEVHMLSKGAFNALLKTLEEPPEHVIFILATTEPHQILPTILSRCQRYDFEKVSDKDIKERIKVILQEEGIEYNDSAINLIIKLADGGMRDALSILEKVLAYSGNSLNEKDVLDIFSLESTEEKIKLLTAINTHNTKEVLDRLNHYIDKGSDIKRLTGDLLTILKDILIFNNTSNTQYLEILREEEVRQIANHFSNDTIIEMIDILMDTFKDFKSVNSIVPIFEITLLKLTSLGNYSYSTPAMPIKETPTIVKEEQIMPKPTPKPIEITPKEEIKEVKEVKEEAKEVVKEEIPQPVISEPEPEINYVEPKIDSNIIYLKNADKGTEFLIDDETLLNVIILSKKELKKELIEKWKNIKKYTLNPTLAKSASLLVDGHVLVASPKMIVLEFPLKTVAAKINLKENQIEAQALIKHIFGRKLFIYAVDRNKSVDIQQKYMSLLQLGQLPKAKNITLDFEGEE